MEAGLEVVHGDNNGKNVYVARTVSLEAEKDETNGGTGSNRKPLKASLSKSSSLDSATDNSNENTRGNPNDSSVEKRKTQQHVESPGKMGYIQMARLGYQELVNAIIQPPRADYKEESLGPPAFFFCGRRFTRTDFALKTKRGMNLQCSHWEPVERMNDRIPVVIYMHGNSSARVEVLPQLSYLLALGVAVFSFDFAGSGKSDGEYVSLGYFEREDLRRRRRCLG